MTDLDALGDFTNVDPTQFAQLVKNAPDSQLADIMKSDQRGKILDTIFSRFPGLFRPDRAGSTNAVIHWTITERPDGGVDTYELVIANGTCTLSPSPDQDPKLAITVGPVDFLKVVSGAGNPMMMFMTGKLKAKGDLGLAANIANLFDIPKP
ncbi:SCP2 sterol-binding domain-containing protein [Dactylosporangium roseum]|uniref:SCP2 sterol-binding domain-containing protein n=1 Tax=Dactylosporangium roseum TaxID=47989 RepID=A0ABY5Z3S4_9ACTN|nr:SCP2 sterol-binding domain-containing protein [Dactylosporangium roseum]UWZ36698.1 SCP2 sterol-binding domain-containing protein [Dactylosporangium roseum]